MTLLTGVTTPAASVDIPVCCKPAFAHRPMRVLTALWIHGSMLLQRYRPDEGRSVGSQPVYTRFTEYVAHANKTIHPEQREDRVAI